MKNIIVIVISFLLFVSCSPNEKDKTRQLVEKWQNKNIVFPSISTFYIKNEKISDSFFNNKNLKIISYTDSVGCLSCNMMLEAWKIFADYIYSSFNHRVDVIKIVYPRNQKDIIYELVKSDYNYPVFIDMSDSINKLNHFPADERFHCFLLDENNNVVLVGDPIQNPQIRDFYYRTISERLGVDFKRTDDVLRVVDLGIVSKFETKTAEIVIPNYNQFVIEIDSIYTSCDCTIAEIDKNVIKPNENATLLITYKPDRVGEFYREVYLKIKCVDKPLIFSIKGVISL